MKILFFCIFSSILVANVFGQCLPVNQRLDCHPDPFLETSPPEEQCQARGCTWCETDVENAPWCFLPNNYGYRMLGDVESLPDGWRIQLQRVSQGSYFGGDANFLTLQATYQSDYRLRIRITNRDEPNRWEVPIQIDPPSQPLVDPLYEVYISNGTLFSMRIERKATRTAIFDTSLGFGGGLTFSDQFIQIATRVPSTNFFGLAEHEHDSLKHSFENFNVWPVYTRDTLPAGNTNIYGHHPYYTILENDGNTHSVAYINSNAQEFVMLPAPGYVYRTIGGVLDMYFFLGPTPENVVQQYTEAVGRPEMVPYWTLGFHLCRWGYNNLTNMRATLERNIEAGIPIDVLYGDIDIMDQMQDFTIDPVNFAGLPEFVNEIKEKGIKFMTILDPAIPINRPPGTYPPYDLGEQMDIWIKRQDGSNMIGRVWPGNHTWPCHFPDFTKPATADWWVYLIDEFLDRLAVDGMWIDMNEPANFDNGDSELGGCFDNNKWNNPPYIPGIKDRMLEAETICPDHVQHVGVHYDVHSLYGWFQSEPTLRAMRQATGKRSFVLSRSTFLGSGRWISHWLGDNWSLWSNLHYSIIGMLEFNQFGIPMVGADICGFIYNTNEQMCQRWMQLGAFYPFSRNHNHMENIDQDPAVWSQDLIDSSKKALEVRYTLLPYLYTLFYKSHRYGNTVVRALWHEFPTDQIALNIDRQFLWGDGLLISPVIDEENTSVNAYFPDSRFYNYYSGSLVATRAGFVNLDAPMDFINVHVQGGKILPTQVPAANTELSKNNPYGFIVALDDEGNASGELFMDDGDSINTVEKGEYFSADLKVSNRKFELIVTNNGYAGMVGRIYQTIRLFGAPPVTQILINGSINHTDFENIDSGEVYIFNLNLPSIFPFVIDF